MLYTDCFVQITIIEHWHRSNTCKFAYVMQMSRGFGLWYLIPLSAIFQLYRGSHYPEKTSDLPHYPEKTSDLPQVTDKLYHIMLYRVIMSPWTGFELTTFVVIGTDCTGSCKSNYHTITTRKYIYHACSVFYLLVHLTPLFSC